MKANALLNFNAVAKLLNIRPRQAQLLFRQGLFPAVKLSHKILRFDRGQVLAAIKRNKTFRYKQEETTNA